MKARTLHGHAVGAGLLLGILAVAISSTCPQRGGMLCLDALPLAWLQADCPDTCCDDADGCCPGPRVLDPFDPARPGLPACCIGGPPDDWLPTSPIALPEPGPAARCLIPPPAAPRAGCGADISGGSGPPRPPPIPLAGVIVLQV